MNTHIPPLPNVLDVSTDDIEDIRRQINAYLRKSFHLSDPAEISDSAITHVLVEAHRTGKIRNFRTVAFHEAIRQALVEEKRQIRLSFGDSALVVAEARRPDQIHDAPLAEMLAKEKTGILQQVLRDLAPAHRRAILYCLAGKSLKEAAKLDEVHVNTAANRKKAALEILKYNLSAYFDELITSE